MCNRFCLLCLFSPFRIEHFGGWLGYVSFNGSMRCWWYIAHAGRAISAIGRRRDCSSAGDGRYAAVVPILGLRQGQVLVSDAARRRVAFSRSMKAISSGRILKSIATAAGSKVPILIELVIVLISDCVAIVAALNRFRNQIFVDGALCGLIAAAMDGRRRFGCRREALVGSRRLSAGGRRVGRMISGA